MHFTPVVTVVRRVLSSGLVSALICIGFGSLAATTTANLLVNGDAESGDLRGWTTRFSSEPRIDDGTAHADINPHGGSFAFTLW